MKIIIASLLAVASLIACADVTSSRHAHPNTAPHSPTKAAGTWIDVRTAEEYRAGHLAGSINVPAVIIDRQILTIEANKDAPIHLYCRSGRRAESARQTLINMGYTNVINQGSYDDLIKQGYQ